MNRATQLQALQAQTEPWDMIVIGGGATGLGCAVDAAARGYRTLLLEQHDFAKGTSSRSTKLIHGGVRYLQQGNVRLVLEALRERGRLMRNAPHLVRHQAFIVPNYEWWEAPFYGVGLKLYDLLAGRLGLGPSQHLSREQTLAHLPTLQSAGLRGGILYYDSQFDDARLAIGLAQTAVDLGAVVLNYFPVTRLWKHRRKLRGVYACDLESGREFELPARVVINATGVFADTVRQMDEAQASAVMAPSQGIHLVLDRSFLPGDSAIMVPRTDDGRVVFVVPWLERALVGTTDTPVSAPDLEPKPRPEEIDFLLAHAGRYLTRAPRRSDVRSVFAGLRPLHKPNAQTRSAAISREHHVLLASSGLVTVTGGKWTTYRQMAEDTVNQAAQVAKLPDRKCGTKALPVHGYLEPSRNEPPSDQRLELTYGADRPQLMELLRAHPDWDQPLHPAFPYFAGEIVWAARYEMARTVEDVLARRTRALLLDARASMEAAPRVAELLATELGRNAGWIEHQTNDYRQLAAGYV